MTIINDYLRISSFCTIKYSLNKVEVEVDDYSASSSECHIFRVLRTLLTLILCSFIILK